MNRLKTWYQGIKKQKKIVIISTAALAGVLFLALLPASLEGNDQNGSETAAVSSQSEGNSYDKEIPEEEDIREKNDVIASSENSEEIKQEDTSETESTSSGEEAEAVNTSGDQQSTPDTTDDTTADTDSNSTENQDDAVETVEAGIGNTAAVQTVKTVNAGETNSEDASAAATPTPTHVHNWQAVTTTVHHDAVTHTVHHDAVYTTVHHDQVTHEEPVYEWRTFCYKCGADITGHLADHADAGCRSSYYTDYVQTGTETVVDQAAWDEQVCTQEAWDETIVDQEAWDETVVTGYRCSGCGAVKEA